MNLPTADEIYGPYIAPAQRLANMRDRVSEALRSRVNAHVEVQADVDDVEALLMVEGELRDAGFKVWHVPTGSPGRCVRISDGRGSR